MDSPRVNKTITAAATTSSVVAAGDIIIPVVYRMLTDSHSGASFLRLAVRKDGQK